jgi:hypothetical protein
LQIVGLEGADAPDQSRMRIPFHFLSLRLSRVEHRLICWTIQQAEIRERIDLP